MTTAECYYKGLGVLLRYTGIKHFRPETDFRVGRLANGEGPVLQAPPAELWQNIIPTAFVLDQLRAWVGGAVLVNSAYRDPDYNKSVGGSSNSLHMVFNACDIVAAKKTAREVYEWLTRHEQAEQMGLGLYNTFVHIDTRGLIGRPAPARF